MENKKAVAVILSCIILAAFAVRFYHFHDWLYFKMDQSRDAMLVRTALEKGPGYLPLLGPRAGATEVSGGYLRLGPIFYYFQYLSALIFGMDSPAPLAYPDLFFSILAIPALYLLSREYFGRYHSLLITAMYAFSFIVIQYSRFAWNPNSLPFFTILSFLGLVKFLAAKKLRWLFLWAASLAIGSQLHFFGFFSLVGISGAVFAYHLEFWKKDFWGNIFSRNKLLLFGKYTLVVIFAFSIFYFPVVISDAKRSGENAKNFVQALASKPQKRPFAEKLGQGIERQIKYQCLLTTSGCYKGNAQDDPLNSGLTVLIFFSSIGAGAYFWKKEPNPNRRIFLVLLIAWFLIFFMLTIPVSFQLRPRFFILVFPLPFLLLGVIFKWLEQKFPKHSGVVVGMLAGAVILLNVNGTRAWFQEQSLSQEKNFTVKRTLILKTKDGVTLGQLERAADFVAQKRAKEKRAYFYVKPEHIAPFKYLLSERLEETVSPIEKIKDLSGQYFAIVPTDRGMDPFEKKFGAVYEIINSASFGQIAVFELKIKSAVENPKLVEEADDEDSQEDQAVSDRVFWKDIYD